MNPIVSIIVPCYNQAQYLPETLDSVLAQTYPNWECIIVNDGSPDNTEEVAKQYCDEDSRFKLVLKQNGGVSSARNIGIAQSCGEYILPLDADDKISPDYLEKAVQHFNKYPSTKLVYCKAELFGEECGEWKLMDYKYENLLYKNIIFCSAIYKKTDFNKTNGYCESFVHGLEDWDFWITFLKNTDIVYVIPDICFYYRIKVKSRNACITNEIGYELRKKIFIKHKAKYEEYLPNIIWLNPDLAAQNDYIVRLENDILKIQTSKAYHIGKLVLKPFKYVKKLLRLNIK